VSSTQTLTTSAWNPLWSFVTVSSPLENAAVRTWRPGGPAATGLGRLAHCLEDPSPDLELLEVALPSGFTTVEEPAR